jgi:hypothetical protein
MIAARYQRRWQLSGPRTSLADSIWLIVTEGVAPAVGRGLRVLRMRLRGLWRWDARTCRLVLLIAAAIIYGVVASSGGQAEGKA